MNKEEIDEYIEEVNSLYVDIYPYYGSFNPRTPSKKLLKSFKERAANLSSRFPEVVSATTDHNQLYKLFIKAGDLMRIVCDCRADELGLRKKD